MYKSIEIENFRGISKLKIDDFKRINLLVGKNNCGKTSVLETLFIFTAPGNPHCLVSMNFERKFLVINREFWRAFFTNFDETKAIEINGKFDNPTEKRSLGIIANYEKTKKKFVYNSEKLLAKREESPIIGNVENERIIAGLKNEWTTKDVKEAGKKMSTKISYVDGDFMVDGIPTGYIEKRVAYFHGPVLSILEITKLLGKSTIKKEKNEIIDILRLVEPTIIDMTLTPDNTYCDIGLNELIPINVMGDGFLSILSIILLLYNAKNEIVLIDEIENGLHYTSQRILWKGIIEAAKRFNVQVFATTHSYECIRAFSSALTKLDGKDDARLFRIEKEEEKFRVITYDAEILEATIESDWEVR
jgi:AAA15 family ATPase/GTPase